MLNGHVWEQGLGECCLVGVQPVQQEASVTAAQSSLCLQKYLVCLAPRILESISFPKYFQGTFLGRSFPLYHDDKKSHLFVSSPCIHMDLFLCVHVCMHERNLNLFFSIKLEQNQFTFSNNCLHPSLQILPSSPAAGRTFVAGSSTVWGPAVLRTRAYCVSWREGGGCRFPSEL